MRKLLFPLLLLAATTAFAQEVVAIRAARLIDGTGAAAAAGCSALKLAVAHKVPVAMGTDAGVGPHGADAHELELMVSWGACARST